MASDTDAPGLPAPASLRAELREFYDAYFACLEDQDLGRWPTFFTEDAVYLIQSAENHGLGLLVGDVFCDGAAMIRDRAAALRATSVFEARRIRHFPGVLRVVAAPPGGSVRCELGWLAIESIVGDPPAVFAVGRSIDELVRGPDGLRLRRRTVVYDHGYVRNSLVFPL